MRVNVLHHAACFDGAASSAIFTAFYRRCMSEAASFVYFPKQHRPGDPYQPSDFDADEVAVLDFRYTRADGLVWFFDHHQSAFQLEGELDHFLANRTGRKFHDPTAPSCTGFIARIAQERFAFDPTPHAELLRWAEIIDSAAFPDPHMPVALEQPALRLMTFVEQNRDREHASGFIRDLLEHPFEKLAQARYIVETLEPALDRHRQDIELLRRRCRIEDGVGEYDLLDQPPRVYNKFIPYYLHPKVRYLVGLSRAPDGRIKLIAGYNPWLPRSGREHDIAALCERFEGGGHPYVGGVSFAPEEPQAAQEAQSWILSVLRGRRAP
jgi:hypothetical protein